MAGLLDLPVELLLRIVTLLGHDLKLYTDKERQSDLARLATTSSALCLVARTLLYGDVVNVRSAGRTFLLNRTLAENAELSALVRHLVAKSEIDFGHPSIVDLIRNSPNLASLALSSIYFTKQLSSAALYSALQAHTQLASFAYGYRGIDNDLSPIAPLLQSWPSLQHLVLDRVEAIPRGEDRSAVHRELRSWGQSPPYRLSSLSIANVRIPDTFGWPLPAFQWLFGATTTLTSLSLVTFDALFDLDQLFSLLSSRGGAKHLEQLLIRDFRDARDPDSSDRAPFDPNTLSAYFHSLTHLTLAENDEESTFVRPAPHFVLPPNLRLLVLYEELFLDWKLAHTVAAAPPPSFRKLKVVGPFPTDPDVKLLKHECEAHGILFEVQRMF
ncbi:hypothetical protein JCM10207_006041 [Rhodosporidiobolus poonsookiae]